MSFPKSLIIGILASHQMVNNTLERPIPNSYITGPFMQLLAQALGFSYVFVAENGGDMGGPLPDGNWTGLMGYAQRGEVDLIGDRIILLGTATQEVSNVVHFLYPYDIARITFMTRKQEYVSDAIAILRPFSYNVWIAIIICLTVMPLMFYLMDWKHRDLQRNVMYTFEIILLQRSSAQNSAKGLLKALWLISKTLLGYFYLSQLLSFLTIPTLTRVRTINELAAAVAKGNYECKTIIGTGMVDLLLQSTNPAFQAIGRDIEQVYDPQDLIDLLKNTKSLKTPAVILMSIEADMFKQTLFVSEDTFFPAVISIATRRDFCCTDKLDQAILYISAAGLYNKILEDRQFKATLEILSDFSGEEDAERKLTMTDFKTVFILLVVGISLAFIVFLMEIVFAKYKKKLERKRRNTFLKVVKINVSD